MNTTTINTTKLHSIMKRLKMNESDLALESLTQVGTITRLLNGELPQIGHHQLGRILEALSTDLATVTITR